MVDHRVGIGCCTLVALCFHGASVRRSAGEVDDDRHERLCCGSEVDELAGQASRGSHTPVALETRQSHPASGSGVQ